VNEEFKIIEISDEKYLEEIMEVENRSFEMPYSVKAMTKAYHFCPWKYCIIKDGKIIGYIFTFKESRIAYHIVTFAIDPKYRKLGLGTKLLYHMIEKTMEKGAREWRLEVETTNESAIKLYEKEKFERGGTIPNYYSTGRHAYIYKKKMIKEN